MVAVDQSISADDCGRTAELLATLLPRDARILIHGCSAESLLLAQAFSIAGPSLESPLLIGIQVPGINRAPGLAHPSARFATSFMTPELQVAGDGVTFLSYGCVTPMLPATSGPTAIADGRDIVKAVAIGAKRLYASLPASGPRGAAEFAYGAKAAGGLRIVARPAFAHRQSRIVSADAGIGPVTLGRADTDVVVTVSGAAALRGRDYAARATALIGIAQPDSREDFARCLRDGRAVH